MKPESSSNQDTSADGRRPSAVVFKFEKLEVWQLALSYTDLIYSLAEGLPKSEEYNLKSQIIRAGTSIALNIAEGSTGQTDAEQNRFLGMALRSLVETVACLRLIQRRGYPINTEIAQDIDFQGGRLFAKLQSFRNTISPRQARELAGEYRVNDTDLIIG
jgi:four helix bundle protein